MNFTHTKSAIVWVILLVSSVSHAAIHRDSQKVLTGTQITFSLTYTLLKNTNIEVINIPEDGRRFDALKTYIERRKKKLEPLFESADAVVSMTNALPSDPLFRFARDANINLININAGQPWSFSSTGVTAVRAPTTDVSWDGVASNVKSDFNSPYFWLSLTNAVRMADIVGTDLARIFPEHKQRIDTNRNALKQELLMLYQKYQQRLLGVSDINLFALSNEFVYLTNDLGLFVDGYFLKQDIQWTEQDINNLSTHLKTHEIKVVLHKWEPSSAIQTAIKNAGAELVILATGDPGIVKNRRLLPSGYMQILRSNLVTLYEAMARQQSNSFKKNGGN